MHVFVFLESAHYFYVFNDFLIDIYFQSFADNSISASKFVLSDGGLQLTGSERPSQEKQIAGFGMRG